MLRPPNPLVRFAEYLARVRQICWGAVGQAAIALRPHELRRIELGRVAGKVFHLRMLPQKGRDLPAAVDGALIPHEHDGTADLAE